MEQPQGQNQALENKNTTKSLENTDVRSAAAIAVGSLGSDAAKNYESFRNVQSEAEGIIPDAAEIAVGESGFDQIDELPDGSYIAYAEVENDSEKDRKIVDKALAVLLGASTIAAAGFGTAAIQDIRGEKDPTSNEAALTILEPVIEEQSFGPLEITEGGNPESYNDPGAQEVFLSPQEQEIIDFHNDLRAEVGLLELVVDQDLNRAALLHTNDMAHEGVLRHAKRISDNYENSSGAAKKWLKLGENVGTSKTDKNPMKKIYDAFVESPKHLENMVDPDFEYIGVASQESDDGMTYVTVRFAKLAERGEFRVKIENTSAEVVGLVNEPASEVGSSPEAQLIREVNENMNQVTEASERAPKEE